MSTPNSAISVAQQMAANGSMPDPAPAQNGSRSGQDPDSVAAWMADNGMLPDMPASASPMRAVVSAASTTNANSEAQTQQLAQRAGMGVDLTRHNPQAAQQRAINLELERRAIEFTDPVLARELANPNFAAVAHDDLDSLSRIGNGAATMRALSPMQGFNSFYLHPLEQKLMEFPLTRMAADAASGISGMAGNVASFFGWHGSGPARENFLQTLQQRISPSNPNLDLYRNGVPDTGNALDKIVSAAAPAAPLMLTGMGEEMMAERLGMTSLGAKILTRILGAAGTGALFSASQGGEIYSAESGAGKTPAEARRAANLSFGLSLVPNVAAGLTDFVPGLNRYPLLSAAGVGAGMGATGTIAQNIAIGQPWQKGVLNSAVQGGAMQLGMHLGTAFLGNMGAVTDAVEESKLRKRQPEAFQSLLHSQFDGDPSFRIPAQDFVSYFQGKNLDPAVMANQVGVNNLDEAAAAGADLEIPRENFFGKLEPEDQRGLLPDVVNPATDLTDRQAEQGAQDLQQWMNEGGAEKLLAEFKEADEETQSTPEWKKVYGDLKQRYVDAGDTESEAEGHAALQANALSYFAKNVGMKADELLALHSPQIVEATEAPGAVLHQGPPDEAPTTEEGDVLYQRGKSRREQNLESARIQGEMLRGDEGSTSTLGHPDSELHALLKGMEGYTYQNRRNAIRDAYSLDNEEANKILDAYDKKYPNAWDYNPARTKAAAPEKAEGASGARGYFRDLGDGRYEIAKTPIGDISTFVHEPAHAYLEMFRKLAQHDEASPALKGDFKKLTDWLGTTPEEAAKNGFTREQHEKWALANEQYVRDGKAPTASLRRVFHQFSVWLGSIYNRATRLGVEISPDVREVMDRLYAGEEAVNEGAQDLPRPLFGNAEDAEWTEQEYRNYAEAHEVSLDKAREQVRAELSDAAEREKSDEMQDERRNVRDAVTQEIDARPDYTAIRSLRRGSMDDGTPIALNRESLVQQFGEERVKALQELHRGLYRKEGGTDAETAAELLGYDSGPEMMSALEAAPRRAQAIEAATRDYLVQKYGDVRYDGTLIDRARFKLENQERGANIYRELRALKARLAKVEQKAADSKAAMAAITVAPLEDYHEAARQMVSEKAPADLQPYRYLNASRRYSRDAFDAVRRGNVRAAAEAKNKELLNHFLFREASAEREWLGKFEKYSKVVQKRTAQQKLGLADEDVKSRGRVGDYRDQFNWLLARSGLSAPMNEPGRSLDAWAQDVYDQGKEPAIPDSIFENKHVGNYKSVPMSVLHDLHAALENVRHLAYQEYSTFVDGKRMEFSSMARQLSDTIRANMKVVAESVLGKERPLEGLQKFLHSVDMENSRMEFLIDKWDGGKRGPWRRFLWEPYQNALGDELEMQHKFTQAVTDIVEQHAKDGGLRLLDKVSVDGIPDDEALTRKGLISIALNMGNEGNLDRLRKTFAVHGWDPNAIDRIPAMLTKNEWGVVQGIWDALKPLGERMNALERKLTGLTPVMVEPTPLKLKLADGTDLDLSGGYYPVKYDARFVDKGLQEEAMQTASNLMERGYGRAVTSRGYTKERTGSAGALLLDYERVLSEHVAKAVKDISHREFMLRTNRLLLDQGVRQALREANGYGSDQDAMAWLRATVNDRNGSIDGGPNDIRRYLMKVRSNLVKASLTFKGSTSVLQLGHMPRLMKFISAPRYLRAMAQFWKAPIATTEAIRELSPNLMRFRGENLTRDYRSAVAEVAKKKGMSASIQRLGYASLRFADHAMSFPLWLARYNEALIENGPEMDAAESHKIAMHAADATVRMAMGTGTTGDLPPIMRSPDLWKQFETTLFGFENLNYQILRHKVGGDFAREARSGNYGRAAAGLTYGLGMTFFVPALLSSYVRGEGPKDGESWGEWAAQRALFFAGGTVPIVKDAVSLLEYGNADNPIMSLIRKDVGNGAREMDRKAGPDWESLGIDALETLGDLTGVPGTAQAAHTARYLHRDSEGKVKNPSVYGALVSGH